MCGRVESMQTSVAGDVMKSKEVEGIFIRENDNLPVLAATWIEQAPFVCRRLKGLPTPRARGHDDEKRYSRRNRTVLGYTVLKRIPANNIA